ncbi:putative phage protein (TIGR02220 family) [Epilithonimonas hungarica]|uniref:conserved phage C-terminal domain-containing protein n=1 Tax=Epilithonimonas hungarica TaxID=454006 RepID=UPI0027878B49|nr:conserved phage C-terminal domain-containing protein [Epilithonimonas hungarica]MDP9954734.1 putative phage protein (TIGR02220 family) [Epilithonimonas hungarica]
MNVYNLSRNFWNWAFENPDKIKPNHSALYFFAIEHCNRLGWKEKFGFPTSMAMEAIGIKSYNTFITTLKELVDFGFIIMIEKSKNQYSANIIALSEFNKADDKALDEALIKHTTKQSESTVQSTGESIDSIDKQTYNTTNLQTYQSTNLQDSAEASSNDFDKNPEEKEKEKSCAKKEKDNSAGEILNFLNETADKNFQHIESNLKFIKARLKEHPPEVLKQIIQLKTFEWKDDFKMNDYLRPETLFNPTKFQTYLQKVEEVKQNPQKFKNYVEQRNSENRKSASKHYDPLDAMSD